MSIFLDDFNALNIDEVCEDKIVNNLSEDERIMDLDMSDLELLSSPIMNEAGLQNKRLVKVVTKATQFSNIKTKTSIALARANNDPDYAKYIKALKIADVLRKRILHKYSSKSASTVRKFISNRK